MVGRRLAMAPSKAGSVQNFMPTDVVTTVLGGAHSAPAAPAARGPSDRRSTREQIAFRMSRASRKDRWWASVAASSDERQVLHAPAPSGRLEAMANTGRSSLRGALQVGRRVYLRRPTA